MITRKRERELDVNVNVNVNGHKKLNEKATTFLI